MYLFRRIKYFFKSCVSGFPSPHTQLLLVFKDIGRQLIKLCIMCNCGLK